MARLRGMHEQECREKDEQLARFQEELQHLVMALRQWQHLVKGSNINVSAIAGVGVGAASVGVDEEKCHG